MLNLNIPKLIQTHGSKRKESGTLGYIALFGRDLSNRPSMSLQRDQQHPCSTLRKWLTKEVPNHKHFFLDGYMCMNAKYQHVYKRLFEMLCFIWAFDLNRLLVSQTWSVPVLFCNSYCSCSAEYFFMTGQGTLNVQTHHIHYRLQWVWTCLSQW